MIWILLLAGNAALMAVVTIFGVEVFSSLTPKRRTMVLPAIPPKIAVVVPAHNEASGIALTIENIQAQLKTSDRLLVVADNCSDDTAVLARGTGADVVERYDATQRGKGFALDFGVRHLASNPPDVVVFIDADCSIEPGTLDALAGEAVRQDRPIQGLYLLRSPPGAGIALQVAELAFLVKNQVRPRGLTRLGLPCHLTGTGMAFPWSVISKAPLANASLVEDMKLGLDLALDGKAPVYCPEARINSFFPLSKAGAASQRQRWEEGHLGMTRLAMGYLAKAIRLGKRDAVVLAMDLLVPPLTFLVLLTCLMLALTAMLTAWLDLTPLPLVMAIFSVAFLSVSVTTAWLAFGRQILPVRAALSIAPYIVGKLAFYGGLARGKRSGGWVRTDRNGPED